MESQWSFSARVATEQTNSATAAPEGVDGHLLVFSALPAAVGVFATSTLAQTQPATFGKGPSAGTYVVVLQSCASSSCPEPFGSAKRHVPRFRAPFAIPT
eukprot:symbB.v1.2.016918.t1/scaffold1304.1/size242089/12